MVKHLFLCFVRPLFVHNSPHISHGLSLTPFCELFGVSIGSTKFNLTGGEAKGTAGGLTALLEPPYIWTGFV